MSIRCRPTCRARVKSTAVPATGPAGPTAASGRRPGRASPPGLEDPVVGRGREVRDAARRRTAPARRRCSSRAARRRAPSAPSSYVGLDAQRERVAGPRAQVAGERDGVRRARDHREALVEHEAVQRRPALRLVQRQAVLGAAEARSGRRESGSATARAPCRGSCRPGVRGERVEQLHAVDAPRAQRRARPRSRRGRAVSAQGDLRAGRHRRRRSGSDRAVLNAGQLAEDGPVRRSAARDSAPGGAARRGAANESMQRRTPVSGRKKPYGISSAGSSSVSRISPSATTRRKRAPPSDTSVASVAGPVAYWNRNVGGSSSPPIPSGCGDVPAAYLTRRIAENRH